MAPNLVDLPLTAIADYLPSTNRIVLAVALTAPSSSFSEVGWNNAKLSTASKAVLASKEYWDLDFAEIREFAGDPSDDDLRALLLNIDAKNTLKTLNIEWCYKIVGHGLEPLRGSTVLQQLSLPHRLGNGVDNALSIDIVVPIIISMINAVTTPLDRLELLKTLPKEWLYGQPRLRDVLTNISSDKILDRLGLIRDLQRWIKEARDDTSSPFHEICTNILQTLLANGLCNCTKPFAQCSTCLKQGCTNCGNDFPGASCNNCGITFCDDCDYSPECNGCGSMFCSACAQLDTVDDARYCRYCSDYHCFGCIEGQLNPCGECFVLHRQKIIARHQSQQAEIARLRQQIDQLQMNDD